MSDVLQKKHHDHNQQHTASFDEKFFVMNGILDFKLRCKGRLKYKDGWQREEDRRGWWETAGGEERRMGEGCGRYLL